ncbi:MAG: hypothetical protein EKK69_15410 [Candidatus Competibacteraceae bacterium]|nr:MAG: hypothetical protein EKK69_15410 [Candidatus Competibacteraceae bacterium]
MHKNRLARCSTCRHLAGGAGVWLCARPAGRDAAAAPAGGAGIAAGFHRAVTGHGGAGGGGRLASGAAGAWNGALGIDHGAVAATVGRAVAAIRAAAGLAGLAVRTSGAGDQLASVVSLGCVDDLDSAAAGVGGMARIGALCGCGALAGGPGWIGIHHRRLDLSVHGAPAGVMADPGLWRLE